MLILIELLFSDPLFFFMIAVSFLFTLGVHEYAHAQMSYFLGDSTAKDQGRLTVNPFAHIDPLGALMFFIMGFGWGKPVPFNPLNLKNKKWGPALVGLAGPLSNFLMAIAVGFMLRSGEAQSAYLITFFTIFIWFNVVLGVFNLLPFPPLDGSHIFFTMFRSLDKFRFVLLQNSLLSILIAVLFMSYIGIPLICRPIFSLLTGGYSLF